MPHAAKRNCSSVTLAVLDGSAAGIFAVRLMPLPRDGPDRRKSPRAWCLAAALAPLAVVAPHVAPPAAEAPPAEALPTASRRLAAIEARVGGRLGVAVLDTGSGRRIEYRAGDRFAMCSTFKLLLAAAVLARVDAGRK